MPWKEQLAQVLSGSSFFAVLSTYSEGIKMIGVVIAVTAGGVIWINEQYAGKDELTRVEMQVAQDRLDARYVRHSMFEQFKKEWEQINEFILDELTGMRYELLRAERRKLTREIYIINRLVEVGEARTDDKIRLEGLEDDLDYVNERLKLQSRALEDDKVQGQ